MCQQTMIERPNKNIHEKIFFWFFMWPERYVSYFSKLTDKCASVTVSNSQQTPYSSLKKNTRLNRIRKILDIYREKHVTHESPISTIRRSFRSFSRTYMAISMY